jgi:hypothetical protein
MLTRFLLLGLLCCTIPCQSATLFPTNSTWRFFRGTNEASLPDVTAWRSNTFEDVNFVDAPAPFWYGDVRPGGTELTGMLNVYTCIFLRKTFVITNAAEVAALRMTHYVDDGLVAWINGQEVFRENVVGPLITTNTLAANQPIDPAIFTNTVISPIPGGLQNGTHVLAVQVFNAAGSSTDLGFDTSFEILIDEATPPTIASVTPSPGIVTSLTQVTVTFSEPVVGVSADDFLINTQPASSVSGSGTTYTFTFAQPIYGGVSISWFPTPGITDEALTPNLFNGTGPGATWLYNLVDTIPPTVANLFPAASVTVRTLTQLEVTFDEEVTGVDAVDLLINNQPATNMTRIPAGPYVFQFASPLAGNVQIQWASNHGITDQATPPNSFGGGSWSYSLDPNASPGDLVINEILASNQSGLQDEDGQEEDWIEIYNRGSTTVDLTGWSLSDDPTLPGVWAFGSQVLGPGQYLVVFASGKDRRQASGGKRFHTNFQLAGGGEFLGLYTADSPRLLASGFPQEFPEQRNDHSFGYDSQGNLRYFSTPTPGGPNGSSTIAGICEPVHFGTERGHFNQPFNLVLTCPTPGAAIRFTTNGQEPTPLNSQPYLGQLRLTNTSLIRAVAFRTNSLPSRPVTHTFFFNLPSNQRSVQVFSIVTATSNLVGRTGILGMGGGSRAADGLFVTNNPATDYHNPSAHGIAWERPVSAELIRPEDNSGFQIDCGIRVQGSDWQRPRTLPTHKFSYRLYFRGDYGKGRLEHPLYPLTTVESFDQVVLRAGYNDANNPFIRDELTRRLSHDMGQVASHGTFATLFTNGFYAGHFNPCERVHGSFMQAHLGGGPDWDVVAPDFAQSSKGLGIVDGDRNDFRNLMTNVWTGFALRPLTNQVAYTALAKRLDLVNFADYCLLNAYAAMGDWPANNWRAARERNNPNAIWRFIVWDAEWANGFDTKTPSYDTFAQTGTGTLDAGLSSTVNSEIARLYQALRVNPEFRLLWADRIQKHFFNNGALTTQSVSNRVQEMRVELQGLFTITDTEFLNWPRDRLPFIFDQFNTYGLYGYSNALYGTFASSNAPAFNQHGGPVAPGFFLSMTAPLGGTIYYTLNGDDPRVPFTGSVSNSAVAYTGPFTLNQSMSIKARTLLNQTNWSALVEANFAVGNLGVPIRVTEIMYNPLGGSPYEFIELQNIGAAPLNLSGMYLDEGITFIFNTGSILAPGARLILANNTDPAAFAARYPGVSVFGYFAGNLNNAGERFVLHAPGGRILLTVDYDDENGWPSAADGPGSSLELVDVQGDLDDPANWRASVSLNGSPGAAGTSPAVGAVRINEVMATNQTAVVHAGTRPDWVELHNTSANVVNLSNWSLSDNGSPGEFVFPPESSIPALGYLVIWCDSQTNTTPGLHAGFELDPDGDGVFLYDASSNRVDGVTFGLQVPDRTLGRIASSWQLTMPTTNAANVAAAVGDASNLAINEWMADPLPGEDDWVELFNRSTTLPVPLYGTYFATTAAVHRITSLSFLPPGGFLQLFADENVGPDHLDLRLSASGGSLILYNQTATEVDRVDYPASAEGVSRGRLPDGTASIVSFPGSSSPEASNYQNTYAGPVLNEILARNQTAVTNNGRVADFVELFNPGAASFDLSGMSLSVDSSEPGEWTFPPGASIAAGGYLVIWCDDNRPPSTASGDFNTGNSLDGESGGVYLFNTSGQLVNSVEYGFQVEDYSVGLSGSFWRLLATPSPGAANSALASLGSSSALRLNEWMANPSEGPDWLEIFNLTNVPVQLGGLLLTDDPSSVGITNAFRLSPLSFIGANKFVAYTADGDVEEGRDHVDFSLNASGESLRLYNTNGANFVLIDSIVFEGQQFGVSEGRLTDGTTNIVRFPGSPTPGESNYLPLPGVVVNEILTHTDPPLEDAIELHNPGTNTVNLGGWFLSDAQDNFKKYRITDGTSLPAGGFRVFYQNQFSNGTPTSFTLNSTKGDEVWLSEADALGNLTGFRTGAKFGAAANGVSFGRFVTSVGVDYPAMNQRTFGADTPGSLAQFRGGGGLLNSAPRIGPVIINELMYHPTNGPITTSDDEYIELRNLTGSAVPLHDPAHPTNTWRLSGVQFAFPPGVTLGANAFLLVVPFDPTNPIVVASFRSKYSVPAAVPVYGPYVGRLNNAGENVALFQPDPPQPPGSADAGFVPQVVVDRVDYRAAAPWPSGAVDGGGLSLQRRAGILYGNEPLNWVASAPTAGSANGSGVVAPPIIGQSPASQTVLEGTAPSLAVVANGSGPLGYQWRFNGTAVPAATNATLLFDFALVADTGDYDCIVSNPGGAALTAPARLLVVAPPTVVVPPVDINIRAGSNIVFVVVAKGSAPLFYQWRLNGVSLPGQTSPVLSRNNVQLADDGLYDVLITNHAGVAITSARLTVQIPPVIVQAPPTNSVPVGSLVSVNVAVTGNPAPFGYFWRQGSVPIASFAPDFLYTNFFSFTASSFPTSILYRIIVTNVIQPNLSAGPHAAAFVITTLADNDLDGIPDNYEVLTGLDTNNAADGLGDLDEDGMSNRDEYVAGTNPTNALSYLRVDLTALSGLPSVQVAVVSNRTYTVQYSDALGAVTWSKLADVIARPINRVETIPDPGWTTNRFYRITTPYQP